MNIYQELVSINQKVQKLVNEQDVDWEMKYDLIFSDNISRKVFDLLKQIQAPLDYYDPDSSNQEDVIAFSDALQEKMEKLQKIKYMFE